MGADKATRSVLKDLMGEKALTQGDENIARVRADYDRVFSSWTAGASKPTREEWVSIGDGAMPALVVEPMADMPAKGTVLFLHGGGWSLGTALCYAPLCRALAAESGLRVVAPDFPLAPEHPYPAGLDAVTEAALWLTRHYDGPLLVAGDSAGGTLAAVVSADPQLNANIKGQALFYPVLDLRPDARYRSRRRNGSGKYFLSNDGILGAVAWYCGANGDPASQKLSPVLEPDLKSLPPTFLLVPDLDPLKDECNDYAERLKRAGVRVELFRARNTIHGCVSFSGRIPQGREGLTKAAHFLRACV